MAEYIRKPEWLKTKLGDNERFAHTRRVIEGHQLHTICTSGKCPNQAECWSRGTATFMVLGDICTRSCGFCNTMTGRPKPVDPFEPQRVAESVKLMALKHVVLTSVDRDDLPDLGASHWVQVIKVLREVNPTTTIEVLIPDFQGKSELIQQIIQVKPEIVSHNLETVRRLTPKVRSAARYETSLKVLKQLSDAGIRAKSGLMLGLGETEDELLEAMDDLLANGCSIITIGQYMQPTRKHLPVQAYIHPDDFKRYREIGLKKGFAFVESGPLVRSSYHAENQI
ncbi:MAG TPA: lipoyl synthase [Bacteroidales bacterium]|nr:lipoyl synthase [Bacteroidales bacterium]